MHTVPATPPVTPVSSPTADGASLIPTERQAEGSTSAGASAALGLEEMDACRMEIDEGEDVPQGSQDFVVLEADDMEAEMEERSSDSSMTTLSSSSRGNRSPGGSGRRARGKTVIPVRGRKIVTQKQRVTAARSAPGGGGRKRSARG